jgi:hypothetical protein
MVSRGWNQPKLNLPEEFSRRPYVLDKNDERSWSVFSVMYNGTHSYYTFRRSCEPGGRLRRMASLCHTLEVDGRPLAIVHNFEFHRTGSINVTIPQNAPDTHSDTIIYLAPEINMKRFMFQIFAIEQTKIRLLARVNAIPPGFPYLPVPDANLFTVDIPEETNDREIELALILSIMFDEMREYSVNEDDDKEDFYNNN